MTDREAFATFVDVSNRDLLKAAWLLTGSWPAAEDLVQSALAATWQRWRDLRSIDHPEAYVRRVMVTTYMRWSRRGWHRELLIDIPEPAIGDSELARVDESASIHAALGVLPRRQRAVIVLRYFLDLSEAETARAMGCAVGTVKSQSAAALAKLQTIPGLADLLTEGRDR